MYGGERQYFCSGLDNIKWIKEHKHQRGNKNQILVTIPKKRQHFYKIKGTDYNAK